MSKFKDSAVKLTADHNKYKEFAVTNFMGGTSYKVNPLDTLRIVAASSIFGEPAYYRDGYKTDSYLKNITTLREYSIFESMFPESRESTMDVFTKVIDSALDYDFRGTLELAVRLRKEFNMRLNPSVIFIRAMLHKSRPQFAQENPGYLRKIGDAIIQRPDDMTNQFEYFMFLNGSKNKMPSIIKRTWADQLEALNAYKMNKYKSKSLIDLVRISHAHSELIDELMKNGSVKVSSEDMTWETLRSAGKSWIEILETIKIPHMALLRNLRGIFTEINDSKIAKKVIEDLKSGVPYGKQFPFRYYSAFNALEHASVNHQSMLLDALEECIDIAIDNFPKLPGKTVCLSDNSGSAWGSLNSQYGTTTIAVIANLSSLITALQSDEGHVGVFGDKLSLKGVSKRNGVLTQLKETSNRGRAQGSSTENGIWIFFDEAIKNKEHYDNIFIYSDQQAGHGGLYGINASSYRNYRHKRGGSYIDVLKLAQEYRAKVNPKVNLFSIQVAGYDNSVFPENLYRGAILGGWTGNEATYASELIKIWNNIESQ